MRLLITAALLALLSHTAAAKDIALSLNDEEQNVLVQVLDVATKSGGLQVSGATMHFLNKIKTAQQANAPSAEPPKDK